MIFIPGPVPTAGKNPLSRARMIMPTKDTRAGAMSRIVPGPA